MFCDLTKLITKHIELILVPKQHAPNSSIHTAAANASLIADHGATDTCIRRTDASNLPLEHVNPTAPRTLLSFPNGSTVATYAHANLPLGPLRLPVGLYENKDLRHSLFAATQATERGCELHETNTGGTVTLGGKVILRSDKLPGSKLWTIPLERFWPDHSAATVAAAHMALVPHSRTIQERVAWCHASYGFPAVATLLSAFDAGIATFPGVLPADIRRYPPRSRATDAGHMAQQRKGYRSTQRSTQAHSVNSTTPGAPTAPTDPTELADFLHARAHSYILSRDDVVHGDATGRFPLPSTSGSNYVLVMTYRGYHKLLPLKDRSGVEYTRTYESGIRFFRDHHGHLGPWIRLDNESSARLEQLFRLQNLGVQHVPANMHRANRAERGIQTAKSHIIASLAGAAENFPLKHWDQLLPQQELTLNLLLPWGPDPSKSAYEGLHGAPYDFAAHPFGPMGCEVMTFVPKSLRTATLPGAAAPIPSTFGQKAVRGWYIGARLDGYRMHTVLVKDALRISAQLSWYPAALTAPTTTTEAISAAIHDLRSLLSREEDPQVLLDARVALNQLHRSLPAGGLEPPPLVALTSPSDPSSAITLHPLATASPTSSPRVSITPAVGGEHVIATHDHIPATTITAETGPNRPVLQPQSSWPRGIALPPHADREPLPRVAKRNRSYRFSTRTPSLPSKGGTTTAHVNHSRSVPPTATHTVISKIDAATRVSPFAGLGYGSRVSDAQRITASARPNRIQAPPILATLLAGGLLSPTETQDWRHYVARQEPTATERTAACNHVILNLDSRGKPLTLPSALSGEFGAIWQENSGAEIDRFLRHKALTALLPNDLPPDAASRCTYYNPKVKEKIKLGVPPDDVQRRVRGAIGGDRITYSGPNSARVAEVDVVKALCNAAISEMATDPSTALFTADIGDFYLHTPLEEPDRVYLRIHVRYMTDAVIEKHQLRQFVVDSQIWFRVDRAIYGHPKAGLLSKQKLDKHLLSWGYAEDPVVSCLYHHKDNGTYFSLVVDDFLVKVRSTAARKHFEDCMAAGGYPMTYEAEATKYIGFTIAIDRARGTLQLSMPGYVAKLCKRYPLRGHVAASTPMLYVPPTYGAKVQAPPPPDTSDELTPSEVTEVQSIVGGCLYYSRMIDLPTLAGVGDLASEQAQKKRSILAKVDRLLAYLSANPDTKITYHASDMVLSAFSDGSYLSVARSRSRAGGIAYYGWRNSRRLNGAVYAKSTILDVVVASAAECEYGSLFLCARDLVWQRLIAAALGYPQAATDIHCDNSCAVSLANDTAVLAKSKAMDMRFHWIRDRVRQGHFNVTWVPGKDNIADFFTKALPISTHRRLVELLVQSTPLPSPLKRSAAWRQ